MATKKELLQTELQMLNVKTSGGIFPEIKREAVRNTRFLIVALGGTGGDTMYALKQKLTKYLKPEDLKERIRFLNIDTDKSACYESKPDPNDSNRVIQVERFNESEFLWLNNEPAKQALSIHEDSMSRWINPNLSQQIGANPTFLDGNGASGIRQIGRLILSPNNTRMNLENRIRNLVSSLTNGNADALCVMVISGISGGTGSGTVVDISFLLRHIITGMPGSIGLRTKYLGFLMLPPTGKSENGNDISKGNRNGYAALKEIDHFMHIAQRNEKYSVILGGRNIVIEKNIYDTCYLIDGVRLGVALSNAREQANAVVADCILDMITSQPVVQPVNAGTVATVDSFMSDAAGYAIQMVTANPQSVAPRDANYVYCALGHGTVLIPIELMKAFVAKNMLDEMYELFQNHSKVTTEDARAFINALSDLSGSRLEQKIMAMTYQVFQDIDSETGGPYYAVNLLRDVAREAENQQNNVKGALIYFRRQEKIDQLELIRRICLEQNRNLFDVFVAAIEEMRKYLQEQNDILCEGRLESYAGITSYTFCPVDFHNVDAKSRIVVDYLKDLVNTATMKKMCRDLLREMVSHRLEWTDMADRVDANKMPKFDGVNRIRSFWAEGIGALVDCTLEDYLIKLYSGDKNAKYTEIHVDGVMKPEPKCEAALKLAASEIVNEMWGAAGSAVPMAELNTAILGLENFNGHRLLLVPKGCGHLRKYIEADLKARAYNDVVVAESFAQDRLSCYTQYTGLPAFMFTWAVRAESDYEKSVQSSFVGMHMSETKGGDLWRDFPNLLVENIWPKLPVVQYTNSREHAMGEAAKRDFAKAKALGLTLKKTDVAGATCGYYEIFTLLNSMRPDTSLYKAFDAELDGNKAKEIAKEELEKAIEECAAKIVGLQEDWTALPKIARGDMYSTLLKMTPFVGKKMQFPEVVMTPYADDVLRNDPSADKVYAEWEEKMAADLLRTCVDYTNDLRGTVDVLNLAYEIISEIQKEKTLLIDFAHFLTAELLHYDEDEFIWTFDCGNKTKEICVLSPASEAEPVIAEYLLYEGFCENYYEICKNLKPVIEPMLKSDVRAESVRLQREFKQKGRTLQEELRTKITPNRRASKEEQRKIIGSTEFAKLVKVENINCNVDKVLDFYEKLCDTLGAMPNAEFIKSL